MQEESHLLDCWEPLRIVVATFSVSIRPTSRESSPGIIYLVEMAISTNPKSTIYRNLYEKTGQRFQPIRDASFSISAELSPDYGSILL